MFGFNTFNNQKNTSWSVVYVSLNTYIYIYLQSWCLFKDSSHCVPAFSAWSATLNRPEMQMIDSSLYSHKSILQKDVLIFGARKTRL